MCRYGPTKEKKIKRSTPFKKIPLLIYQIFIDYILYSRHCRKNNERKDVIPASMVADSLVGEIDAKKKKPRKMYSRLSGDKWYGEKRDRGLGRGSGGWVIKIKIERSGRALLRR